MRRVACWAAIIVLASVCAWLPLEHSCDVTLWLQPGFLVVEVRSPTVILQQANHRYTVQCGERCGVFVKAKKYQMRKRGGVLEYRIKGKTIGFPILEEQIFFPTQPGGLG